ncbi:14219_t:CDS:2 [Racocetra fulgida]|uniref:14219_t:CDS:1 n=1 Tax=Racocetra fulgida TaxID=60492 RepID=A0A9N9C9F9_9GLOM|nr:14219_t:CDS:2 [Racocetra fulgida]
MNKINASSELRTFKKIKLEPKIYDLTLESDSLLDSSEYNDNTLKAKKTTEAGTQLVNDQDFQKFRLQFSNSDKLLSQPSSLCIFPNSYISSPLYNPLQIVPTFTLSYSDLEPTLYTAKPSLPTFDEFLKSINKNESIDDYYQSFLSRFEQQ